MTVGVSCNALGLATMFRKQGGGELGGRGGDRDDRGDSQHRGDNHDNGQSNLKVA